MCLRTFAIDSHTSLPILLWPELLHTLQKLLVLSSDLPLYFLDKWQLLRLDSPIRQHSPHALIDFHMLGGIRRAPRNLKLLLHVIRCESTEQCFVF